MFTRRLLLGYVSITLLLTALPCTWGAISAVATRLGFDAFPDGVALGTVLAIADSLSLGLSLRNGRRPTELVPIGYALLAAYAATFLWYVAVRLIPALVVDRSSMFLADLMAITLVLISPCAWFVWRFVRDPALAPRPSAS